MSEAAFAQASLPHGAHTADAVRDGGVADAPVAPDAVFLIHGLGGTQYDLGSMHKRLKNAGFVTHSLTLPGHGTDPKDLAGIVAEQWLDAVTEKYRSIINEHPRVHLMGMCMGSLLAEMLAAREKHSKGKLIMLAPPVFIDGWATPWYRGLRPLLYLVPGLAHMKIEEEDPFGIKNEQLRAIVKAKFERGENFHYQWVPLECIRQVDRLRGMVMKSARDVRCPTLIVHAREDELTSLRSANFMVEAIGGGRARMVVLEDSYHMVCVDNDREIVAKNVLEFLGAAMPGATSVLANDPRMSVPELATANAAVLALLATGNLPALRDVAIPDLAWIQPGSNAVSGVHVGKTYAAFAARVAEAGGIAFAAPGTTVFNRGIALTPVTLTAARNGAQLASPGALLCAFHGGKLLEVRWFADAVDAEDAWFGAPPAPDAAADNLETTFEQAAVDVKTLKRAPENAALLDLYALYKQASSGDVSGDRPSVLDVVGRAKFDAWTKRRGTSRSDAMRAYVEVVNALRAKE